jgi:hypothetical protein
LGPLTMSFGGWMSCANSVELTARVRQRVSFDFISLFRCQGVYQIAEV